MDRLLWHKWGPAAEYLGTVRTCTFRKMLEISLSAERLLASREGLCPVELGVH